jgi:Domain of unknown function (DUF4118)
VAALTVAVAWIPLRSHEATVDVALALVVVITAMGASGRRPAVVSAAVTAALSYTFFDTAPYERFAVSRLPDVVTGVLLVVVGLVTGELAVRVARQRYADLTVTGDLGRVRDAASLLAAGEELIVMIGSVADELVRLLDLRDCWFAAEPIEPGELCIGRDGTLSRAGGNATIVRSAYRHSDQVALPVWGQGQILGHFVLEVPATVLLPRDQLLVAITLSDQVGAALYAQAPPVPPITLPAEVSLPLSNRTDATSIDEEVDPPPPHLRVIRGGGSTPPPA